MTQYLIWAVLIAAVVTLYVYDRAIRWAERRRLERSKPWNRWHG